MFDDIISVIDGNLPSKNLQLIATVYFVIMLILNDIFARITIMKYSNYTSCFIFNFYNIYYVPVDKIN